MMDNIGTEHKSIFLLNTHVRSSFLNLFGRFRQTSSKGWRSAAVKYVDGQAVNDERRRIRAICQEQGITRKRFRKLQKLQRRLDRESLDAAR